MQVGGTKKELFGGPGNRRAGALPENLRGASGGCLSCEKHGEHGGIGIGIGVDADLVAEIHHRPVGLRLRPPGSMLESEFRESGQQDAAGRDLRAFRK